MGEFFKKTLSNLLRFTKFLIIHIIPILIILIILKLFWYDIFPKSETYGHIWVDSPEIYTRERLVNDRFLQDTWLQGILENSDKFKEKISLSKQDQNIQVGNTTREKSNTDKKGLVEKPSKIHISSESNLIDKLDYRDRIRNLIIENQLDDRHDLNGNSLYRLKFDTTIVPGNRTSANAWIEIKLSSTYSGETNSSVVIDLEKWKKIYEKWLINLQSRLNQTHTELINSYTNNEFKKSDYKEFVKFALAYNNHDKTLITKKVKECKFIYKDNNKTEEYSIDHKKYKNCIDLIATEHLRESTVNVKSKSKSKISSADVNKTYKSIADLNLSTTGIVGVYASTSDQLNTQIVDEREVKNATLIENNLNVFMHINTLKLVFGIKLTAEDIKLESDRINVPELNKLSKISILSPDLRNRNQNIYQVKPKNVVFLAQEKNCTLDINLLPFDFNKTTENNSTLYIHDNNRIIEDIKDITDTLKFSVSKIILEEFVDSKKVDYFEVNKTVGDYVEKYKKELKIDKNESLYEITIKSGLIRFIIKALENTKTYTYAITPKMRANNVRLSYDRTLKIENDSSLLNTLLSLGKKSNINTLNRIGTTVGYGNAREKNEAIFGWIIRPQFYSTQSNTMIHTAQQVSLSALLSVPSWWDKGNLEVKTKWIKEDGTTKDINETNISYEIDFPLDFKQLETKLLSQIHLGPDLYGAAQEPINLIACQPGTILIRGKRLWRSTMVTLGTQTADQILVLPNMKGIIAKFDKIINPITIAEEKAWSKEETNSTTIQRRVRVWTSQGTISLPHLAEIGVYKECHKNRIEDIIKRRKGNDEH